MMPNLRANVNIKIIRPAAVFSVNGLEYVPVIRVASLSTCSQFPLSFYFLAEAFRPRLLQATGARTAVPARPTAGVCRGKEK